MRFLITGGCGFIGSNLIRYLIGLGHTVFNVDSLTYAGNQQSLDGLGEPNGYMFERLDICDGSKLQPVFERFQPDAVLHLAAESHVDRSIDGPSEFIKTNVFGTFQMLQVSNEYRKTMSKERAEAFRFLHVSTDEVFGSLGPTGYFCERTAYDPHSPYSASKASSDHLVRAWYHTYGLPILITNCSNNYGPYQFPEKLIPVVILKCIREESIPVYGRGENVRDWLYVTDHCRAIEAVVTRGKTGETYAVGGNNEIRNIDLVTRLCRIMDEIKPRSAGKQYEDLIKYVADRPGHDHRYAIDATKLKLELGWEPSSNHDQLLRDTVRWYLENETWWERILSGSYRLERLGVAK